MLRLVVSLIVVLIAATTGYQFLPDKSVSLPPHIRAESDEDGPPSRELMEARFGGDKTARKQPAFKTNPDQAYASDWQPLGPINMVDRGRDSAYEPSQGRVNSIAADPQNPQRLYLGAASGGVWVTKDGGVNWVPRAQGLPVITISSVVVDPANGDTVYAATGDGDGLVTPSVGVYKTIDGGTTWQPTGLTYQLGERRYVQKLAIDPTNGARIYAATTDGVQYTRDGGTTWTLVRPSGETAFSPSFLDVKLKPGTPTTVYAVSHGGRFFRSTDSGGTWQAITAGLPDPMTIGRAFLAVTPASPDAVFFVAGAADHTLNGIYRSTDGGSSFAAIPSEGARNEFGSAAFFNLAIAVSPANLNEIYIGGFTVTRTPDGGTTWLRIPGSQVPFFPGQTIVHVDIHDVQYINGAVYVASDGGLHRTTDGGTNWTNLSPTLDIGQIYSFGISRQNPNTIYVGEQDNGLNRFNGMKWEHCDAGDYGRVAVDPTNDQVVYGSANFALNKSTDGFTTTTALTVTNETKRFEGAPVVIHPTTTQTVYAGYQNVHRTTDGGATWQPISTFTDGLTVDVITLAPSDPRTIYLGRSRFAEGKFYRSTDAGATWAEITANLPAPVTGAAVDPNNPARLWVSLQSGTADGVYFSSNGGVSWTNYSGTSLPNSSTRCIIYENGSQDGLYVGTVAGVYYRNSTMTDWQPFNINLPNVVVSQLDIDYTGRRLRAGTYGRGLWQSPLAVRAAPLLNISTRMRVETGDNVLIGGFIITGGTSKKVLIRGIGPSLPETVPGRLDDPTLNLDNGAMINDDWKSTQKPDIEATGIPPKEDRESAIVATLAPGPHTVILSGKAGTTGVGLVEVYDLEGGTPVRLANISTRGQVQTGDNVMIGGIIVGGPGSARVLIRAIGPSLPIAGKLTDTVLELVNGNGERTVNDDWRATQETEIINTTIPPRDDKESSLIATLAPGNYTAILRGKDGTTGIGLVEAYNLTTP